MIETLPSVQENDDCFEVDNVTENKNNYDKIQLFMDYSKTKFGCLVYEKNLCLLHILPQDMELTKNIELLTEINDDEEDPSLQFDNNKFTKDINLLIENILIQFNPETIIISSRFDEICYDVLVKKFKEKHLNIEIRSFAPIKENDNLGNIKILDNVSDKIFYSIINDKNKNNELIQNCIKSWIEYNNESNEINATANDSISFNMTSSKNIKNSNNQFNIQLKFLKYISLNDRVLVDENTIHSLRILPSIRKFGSDNLVTKGYFSLLELLDRTHLKSSKTMLRSWILSPSCSSEVLEKRYNFLDILLSTENNSVFDGLQMTFKKYSDMNNILLKLKSGSLTIYNWRKLNENFQYGIILYKELCELDYLNLEIDEDLKQLSDFDITDELTELSAYICNVIDFDESKDIDDIYIREGLFPEFDSLRETYNNLEDILSSIVMEVEEHVQNNFEVEFSQSKTYFNAVYIPQIGFLITIDLNDISPLIQKITSSWEQIFQTETNCYFKNEQTNTLDNEIGDIYCQIEDLKLDILLKLQQYVTTKHDLLITFGSIITKIDVYLSLAVVSDELNYVKPTLVTNSNDLIIKKGRHPLFETILPHYIANDFLLEGGTLLNIENCDANNGSWIDENAKRLAIVTGANASGKSVFMSQVGLIVYLAHIGCFVPAESARIGIVDMILSNIETKESISNNHSSFELDNIQMMKNLSVMTERSLILMDEFGKGTGVIEGPSLFGGILSYLKNRPDCPRVICCSHYHELFKEGIISPNSEGLKFYTTEIILNSDKIDKLNENMDKENRGITFLYRIKEGICNNSFGIYCASICGIAEEIIERATFLKRHTENGNDIMELFSSISKQDEITFDNNQSILKRFLSWDIDLESTSSSDELKTKLASLISSNI
ncbi:hypothetical protein TPHA_0J01720 [Tetrapisispora phaffii CBS 4417]|uniref:DNA mismatch repair proteins mutS family domain-containing protein n=1 Tax=Tetrapisispora phaffii (strain ATCC 24235 / CBS 4417 / NBRC 1672 / NRRL Y-8282 / UCD 70-5) TaxID=1071381 RepID=G8BYQ1_TETPH|nr:hypothetical protein TPHA_0J01720 [Tetrapisispora phaffii CBS 4417]CCE64993.1 hypothetical protein TPHA_0J01720 [Tetrapisispora phaffii CBS 4417]